MSAGFVLSIDQGTTNTKALLVDREGRVAARATRAMQLDHPRPGWTEQSAIAIWQAVADVIAELAAGRDIVGIAISNQRETVVLWDAETGEPLAPAIGWQCRRSADRCAALRKAGYGEEVERRSGLAIDPMFPAAKIAWLLDHVPDARARSEAGRLRVGTIDSWLLWKLTGAAVHATDPGNASRTQLLGLRDGSWDAELCRIFDVPPSVLPEIQPSDSLFGQTASGTTALPAGVPIHAVMGDSHAAMFAQSAIGGASAKVTIGTGSSVMVLSDRPAGSASGLSATIAWNRRGQPQYAREGNILLSGGAVAFMVRLLGLADEDALTDLAVRVPDSGGVIFVPALAGLGAPYWDSDARGILCNMSMDTAPSHLARAALEAIAFQIADVVEAAETDAGLAIESLAADGGASRNGLLLQILADMTGRPVVQSSLAEASGLGVALMAWQMLDPDHRPADAAPVTAFRPAMAQSERTRRRKAWHRAVAQARMGPADFKGN